MSPAKSQFHLRVQAGKALVAGVAIATDDARLYTVKLRNDYFCGARLVDHIVNHGARLKHPHVPAVPNFAQHIDKDSPTGFIGMPIGLGTKLRAQRIVNGFEQGR